MGRFGQPRYKDPVGMFWKLTPKTVLGTPAALRGIREVTDKNKHILLEGIFNGDFIPDHLLPVGIHRCGQQRWRAHLCTVGHKFSGPPRDTVRDACEDRRKFCEENGVNFVLYGKQTHAKGPIGSRPIVPSTFPRLSDYVTSMSRAATSGGISQAILSSLRSNGALKEFFDAIDNSKRIITAKVAERSGTASYVVTKSHASLHRKIVEDSIDNPAHCFVTHTATHYPSARRFHLCPIAVDLAGIPIEFVWGSHWPLNDGSLQTYLDSILDENDFPHSQIRMTQAVKQTIEGDIAQQIAVFQRVNEVYEQLLEQHGSLKAGIKYLHQHTPHVVHTRKAHPAPSTTMAADQQDPNIEFDFVNGSPMKWNAFTADQVTMEFVADIENSHECINPGAILFMILQKSLRHRMALLHVQTSTTKKSQISKSMVNDESHSGFADSDVQTMWDAWDASLDEQLAECAKYLR